MKGSLRILSVLMLFVMVFGLTSCASSGASSGKELNIYIWTEYVPDSVIEKFEKDTGIKVNVSTFSSNEDMLSKVKMKVEER